MSSRHSFMSTTGLLHSDTQISKNSLTSARGTMRSNPRRNQLRARHGVIPLSSGFLIVVASLFSLLFIVTTTLAFVGARQDVLYFQPILDAIALNASGIVLVGENVDVDIDEPSVTIRWSIIACGSSYVLPQSYDIHGSSSCGLPSMPLQIFVDSSTEPAATYDPNLLPVDATTGQRTNVQNLVQFDSDHVLDVHNARLYPFDAYVLTSTLRAITSNDSTSDISLPILQLPVVPYSFSFSISSSDSPTLVNSTDSSVPYPSRDIDMLVCRSGGARGYAMLLFGLNWVLTHCTFGIVVLALYHGRQASTTATLSNEHLIPGMKVKNVSPPGSKDALKQLAGVLGIILVIPQLRHAMPDSPGFDGVLLDTIGFFPQMAITGLSAVSLLIILVKRELDRVTGDDPLSPASAATVSPSASVPTRGPAITADVGGAEGTSPPDLTPLRKPRSSMDINHFRKISLTTAELSRNARSSQSGNWEPSTIHSTALHASHAVNPRLRSRKNSVSYSRQGILVVPPSPVAEEKFSV